MATILHIREIQVYSIQYIAYGFLILILFLVKNASADAGMVLSIGTLNVPRLASFIAI